MKRLFASVRLGGFASAVLLALALSAAFLGWVVYRWLQRPPWLGTLPPNIIGLLDLLEAAASLTLLILWWAVWRRQRDHQRRTIVVTSVAELRALEPAEFEHYVADLFRRKGYSVRVRGRSGDLGVDLEVTTGLGRKAIVQCKRYQNTVGADVVRELYGTLIHERAARGFLVTTADISEAARDWARHKPLTLIDGPTLVQVATALAQRDDLVVA